MAKHNISLARGETLGAVVFALTNPDGTPYDLTGWSASLVVHTQPSDCGCDSISRTKVIELLSTSASSPRLVIDGLAGEITISVTSAQTNEWTLGEHTYRLWVTDPAGAKQVAFEGFFTVSA
jgi:hypothetical protein